MTDLSTPTTMRVSPQVLRLRTAARAAGYNPDSPTALDALACLAGLDTQRLAAVLTGRAPLDQITRNRASRTVGAR